MKICNKCNSSMSLWCDAEVKQLKTDRINLKTEIKELRRKAKIIKVGNLMPLDFPPPEGLIKMNLEDPETAYLYGWESAIFECGEVLSK